LPTATRRADDEKPPLAAPKSEPALTDPVRANIIVSDPREQASVGRHQIGILAGFVGIRIGVLKGLRGAHRSAKSTRAEDPCKDG